MSGTRAAAVAGRFYPAGSHELRTAVEAYIHEGERRGPADDRTGRVVVPKGIIAPHAGYVYSGSIAGTAYARIAPLRGRITRVILLGPAHYVPFRGLAAPTADSFETPLGEVPIDRAALERLRGLPQVHWSDAAHAREHSLEVHLPFLQAALGEFSLVPLVIGEATAAEVAAVVDELWGGNETLFAVSSDLSHFHDYEEANAIDAETSALIERMDVEALEGSRACGYKAIGGFLTAAKRRGLRVECVDRRNSGDTAGPRDRVVGYGSYIVG